MANASSYASILKLKGPKFGGDSTKLGGFLEEVQDRAHRADDGEFDGLLKSHVDDELDWLDYYFYHPTIPTDRNVLFIYADPEDYPNVHSLQKQIYNLCLSMVVDHLEVEVVQKMQQKLGKTRTLTLHEICTYLRQTYSKITSASIAEIKAPLDSPYVPSAGIAVGAFIAIHVDIHFQLNQINKVRYGLKPSPQIEKCLEYDD